MSTTDWPAGALIGVLALAALVAHLAAAWPEPAGDITQHDGPPHAAHDAIEQWITSVTADWTEQAELRRRALDIRARIDHKETS